MLCAFAGPPRIVRLHGRGEVVPVDDPGVDGVRAVVRVHVERIADSCGYGVPLMSYEGERPHHDAWAQKKLRTRGPEALVEYQREKNAVSLDGLPAVEI